MAYPEDKKNYPSDTKSEQFKQIKVLLGKTALVLMLAGLSAGMVVAQDKYSSRPITVVVPLSGGQHERRADSHDPGLAHADAGPARHHQQLCRADVLEAMKRITVVPYSLLSVSMQARRT